MKTILNALITGGLLVAAWQTAEAQTQSFVVATDVNPNCPQNTFEGRKMRFPQL